MQDFQQSPPVAHAEVGDRATFITRTYLHLLGAVLALVGLEVVFFKTGFAQSFAEFALGGRYTWLAVLGGFMLLGTVASSMARRAGSLAAQYAGLSLYVVGEAIILAPLLYLGFAYGGGELVSSAAQITGIAFAGLTAIVVWSRRDLSGMAPYLRWGGFCAMGLIVASILFGFQLGILFFCAMIVLAGGYILHTTSAVMQHYPTTHHVSAALELFAAVALMFWYVLQLLMSLSRD